MVKIDLINVNIFDKMLDLKQTMSGSRHVYLPGQLEKRIALSNGFVDDLRSLMNRHVGDLLLAQRHLIKHGRLHRVP